MKRGPTYLDEVMQSLDGINAAPAKIWSGAGDLPPDEVHAYASRDGSHWLYVTWGLSALWRDESEADGDVAVIHEEEEEDPPFELTLRLRRQKENVPPEWPVSLLENLCRYVATTGHALDRGHLMHLRGPLALDQKTELCALGFVVDPVLGIRPLDPLYPDAMFLSLVALTDDEYRAARRWTVDGVATLLARSNRLQLIDLARTSLLSDPQMAKQIEAGTAREGSSTSELFVPEADWKKGGDGVLRLRFGAASAQSLADLLSARLPFNRPLLVVSPRSGKRSRILFEHGARAGTVELTGDLPGLRITLSDSALTEWRAMLTPRRGRHQLRSPSCVVEIVRSEIRDRDGRVVEVVE